MRLRGGLPFSISAGVALAGCQFGRHPTDPGETEIARIVVSPASVTLDPQQTEGFHAVGYTAAGDSVPATVGWTASAGSVSANGLYTADTSLNDATVTATLTTASMVASGQIRKRRVVQVLGTPANARVPAGPAREFTPSGPRNTRDT